MRNRESQEEPTNPVGIAMGLRLEVEIGVTSAAAVASWREGRLVILPGLEGLPARLCVGHDTVAVGCIEPYGDRLAVRIARLV